MDLKVEKVTVKDIRFPTYAEGKHGSDAMHTDPDYSCAYVILETGDASLEGHGLTFTIGRGTEVVVFCVKSLEFLVLGKRLGDIFDNFSSFWRSVTSESQLRWIGPEKGVIHLAASAIINALWDLWAKIERKPLWKLLVDMDAEKLASTIDYRYISEVLTKEDAIAILKKGKEKAKEREQAIIATGYPAYTTSVGWLGYSDETVRENCRQALAQGYTRFKVKVGADIDFDKKRLTLIRQEIGDKNKLMVDANQRWNVDEAIDWMKQLTDFKPLWIEEPTAPDDVLGHARIAQALNPLGIGVATGEQCHNRVMFKQMFQAGSLQFCQIDSTRLCGVNEVLAVILMAHQFQIPVCPHAGGVGLCEYVQHLAVFDYIAVSGSLDNRMTEFCDHQHEHFKHVVKMKNGAYVVPMYAGYSAEMLPESMAKYEYPNGTYWRNKLSSS